LKRFTLDTAYDDDYLLTGMQCALSDYKLAWLINRELTLQLKRAEDISFYDHDAVVAAFAYFDYYDELNRISYQLFANKDESVFLLPELKHMDYLLMIKGVLEHFSMESFTGKLKSLPGVQFATRLEHLNLKSKHNLILPDIIPHS
jgi:hypothetical protein